MTERTMRAIHVHAYGGPEALRLEEAPRPEPQAGEVLMRVHAVGVLPVEWKIRQGLFRSFQPVTFPYISGSAFAGVVKSVGAGVTAFAPEQAVFGRSATGAYAEYVTAAVETLALKPDTLSFDEAASISGGATTAWTALFDNARVQAGQRVLIHGAAGGVGSFAVQFARWKGAQVIGTASTANLEFVRSLGAETVLDTLGGETLRRSMQVVRPGGVLVSLIEPPSQEEAQALGIRAIKNTATQPYPSTSLLQTIASLIAAGEIRVTLAQVFPLEEASRAHELSQTGHGRGRIVLHIAD